MELNYQELSNEIIERLEGIRQIALATCAGDRVFARTVSPVNDGLTIYFSTGGNSEKARQLGSNPNVALAIENIQIEATAESIGHPSKHPHYTTQYPPGSDDIVVIIKPTKITLYKFLGKACEEVLDIENGQAYRTEL